MKAKLLIQVKLQSRKDGVLSERVCWIDNARVRTGSHVTLKNSEDPDRRWTVIAVSEGGKLPEEIHKVWHVGGL